MSSKKQKHSFFYRNGLSLVLVALAILSFSGQIFTGWKEYNDYLQEHNTATVGLLAYLHSGHFIQATFENWESEFLQMGLFVVLSIFLRQLGSSESKPLDEPVACDKPPVPHKDAPWPVKRGGWILKLYENSLSIALFTLFAISFMLHWYGSCKDYNYDQALLHKPAQTMIAYLGNHRFWFESFQNWQSEFLSVFVLVWFSIYLRQKNSPQSKAVDDSYEKTGE